MHRILFTFSLLFWSICIGQSYQKMEDMEDVELLKTQLTLKSENTSTIRAQFEEYIYSSLLKNPKICKGSLTYSKEGSLRWEKTSPKKEIILTDGKAIQHQIDGKIKNDSATKKIVKRLESLLVKLLSAEFLESDQFELTFFENKDSYKITLVPKKKNSAKHLAQIDLIFTKANLELHHLTLQENTFDYISYKFIDVRYNTTIHPNLFKKI